MKQRKEFNPSPLGSTKKTESKKTIQELTDQITHIIGKDPKKAAKAIEAWVDQQKPQKKAS